MSDINDSQPLPHNQPLETSPPFAMPPITQFPELPDWGVYSRWPMPGHSWIHAQDISLAIQLIPSGRVFKRSYWDRTFYLLHYGKARFRVRPTMWQPVEQVDLEVNQQVELLSCFGRNDPGIYRIAEILYSPRSQRIEFRVRRGSMELPESYLREDLRPLQVTRKLSPDLYNHPLPKAHFPTDLEFLNVGSLFDEEL